MTTQRSRPATSSLNQTSTKASTLSVLHAVSTAPWPTQVNGAALLDELTATIRKFVVLEANAADAVALWAVHTHAIQAFSVSPRLGITSVVMRCGKTTLLDVLLGLVREPLVAANATAAGIFTQIDARNPTLLIDEADTFLAGKDELRGILNSGHRKSTAYACRAKATYSTWAPVVIAMIGRLPPTLDDRCIPVRLERRRAGEEITRFRHDKAQDLVRLCRMSGRWAADNLTLLASTEPAMPVELQDRAADNWRPLLAIADAAGGKWPKLARQVAISIELSKQPAEQDPAVLLLEDIYEMTQQSNENLTAERLVSALVCLEDRPWADWKGGQPITKKAVANLLAPFKIAPVQMRVGLQVLRGYHVSQFEDAFARYVSAATKPLASSAERNRVRRSG